MVNNPSPGRGIDLRGRIGSHKRWVGKKGKCQNRKRNSEEIKQRADEGNKEGEMGEANSGDRSNLLGGYNLEGKTVFVFAREKRGNDFELRGKTKSYFSLSEKRHHCFLLKHKLY